MNRFTVSAVLAGSLLVSSTASGLAARTFVSTSGNDAAACSLAAPCRSFAAALAQTATDGEIIVLDSGGYGAVAISQDVSIIAPKGVYAGISVFPTSPNATGVTAYDARVVLRGLSINGQGGDFGIWVFGDAVVHIEDCTISNVDQYGVRISGLIGSPEVFIEGSVIRDNGGSGIYATGAARVHVDRTSIQRNGGDGIQAINGPVVTVTSSTVAGNAGNGTSAVTDNDVSLTTLTVSDSAVARNDGAGIYGNNSGSSVVDYRGVVVNAARNTITQNGDHGIVVSSPTNGRMNATVTGNLVSSNAANGLEVSGGPAAQIFASNNTVTGNAIGVRQSGGSHLRSYRNNALGWQYVTKQSGSFDFDDLF